MLPHTYGRKDDARLTSVRLSRKSRTERPGKIKTDTELANIPHGSDTTFKIKRSKVNLQGVGAYCTV